MNDAALVEQIEECGLQVTRAQDGRYQVVGVLRGAGAPPVELPDAGALAWWWAGACCGMSLVARRIDLAMLPDGAYMLTARSWPGWLWARLAGWWKR